MIELVSGNIFDTLCESMVVPVNVEGVAGAGLAKQFKDKYPYWYMNYHRWCSEDKSGIGKIHTYQGFKEPVIISFPTKKYWKNPSKYSYIDVGLEALVTLLDEGHGVFKEPINSIAIPKLGCGLGGLDWDIVLYDYIYPYLNGHKVKAYIYI